MIWATNPNFNTLPAIKQPWLIKHQMLRYLMAYPKKNFSYPGPSMWFSNRINWIISDVQGKNFFLIIFLASNKVLAMLGSWIGTCSVFFHSYSVSPGVHCVRSLSWFVIYHNLGHPTRQVCTWKTSHNHVSFYLVEKMPF